MGHPKLNHGGLGMPGDGWPCADQPGNQSARLDVTGRFCRPIRSGRWAANLKLMRTGHSTVIPATKGELLSIADSKSMDRTSKSGLGLTQVCR